MPTNADVPTKAVVGIVGTSRQNTQCRRKANQRINLRIVGTSARENGEKKTKQRNGET